MESKDKVFSHRPLQAPAAERAITRGAEAHSRRAVNPDRDGINSSPRMVAQRRQFRGLFGKVAQLSETGLAPGQERHLPHETRHVVNGPQAKVVQRVKRQAKVTWAITHLVRVQDHGKGESLFGKNDDWQSGEVSPGDFGQLSHDQLIMVDDESVFMSRRGTNQEDPSRRQHDRDTDELKHRWLKVLAIWVDDEFKAAPEDTYVRAETIKLIDVSKPPQKDIHFRKHGQEDVDTVSTDLRGFHGAWQQAAAKRRRSIGRVRKDFQGEYTDDGDEITSGWNWDKYDEGENVSGDMQKPEERATFDEVEKQRIISANYQAGLEREPIAYMVLEVRRDGDGPYMYIRWLIAHPEKGGGGSRLIIEAIRRFNAKDTCTELRVDSAFSAVAWYESQGFKKVSPEKSAVKKGVGYADTELVYRKAD